MNTSDLLTAEDAQTAADILASAAAGLLEAAAQSAAERPEAGGYASIANTITTHCDDAAAIARVLTILSRYTTDAPAQNVA